MVKMNSQTKIIVFTAVALTMVDLTARYFMTPRVVVANTSDVITAREIRLVDDNGNLRAHLYTDENTEPGFLLYDRNGVNRAQLDTFQNIPSLILSRPDGQRSTYYGMDTEGRSIFDMYGDNGEDLASIDVTGRKPTFSGSAAYISNGNTTLDFSGDHASIVIK